ncbi:hypothetical protein L1049_005871 [Liquidambar formosana]|uniref:Uncharacterized protein n=1 Tax=Liquidambar formosana TaxID=63359 RepID=A0AAP0WQJ4_LIQFO
MEGKLQYKKGLWTEEEDRILLDFVRVHGKGQWNRIPRMTGLKRCGKSCRLRWMNYLSPNVKRGDFSEEEDDLIIRLHKLLGNRWSLIAGRVPGRTDNQVKNHWNTHLCKKLGIKRQNGKAMVGSSKAQTAELENSPRLVVETNATLLHDGGCNSSSNDVKAMATQDSTLNAYEASNEQAQSTSQHCVESLWFANSDQLHLINSPGLMEFLDGYPFDLIWQGL